ncbi:hypothetical protein FQN55_004609 [Onygenales sp. PD_40]|nr:hypothetical protein FQN55_004609 [Onygenales sp. PD_40]KAK2787413.1 hypothetical protein FQN53_005324 [Emmonsiellopsis sp. PD_33]KAK2788630.1 hypothetical protein FQN52_006573 [Onygenales sp. PD_12]
MANSFFQSMVAAPEINPLNRKAKSIPILNPFDKYGRVFLFSWLGFMVAFLSWYAFPPLLTITIRKDLNMSQADVANSNIVALLATFLVRVVCGPLCDRFGPRWVFIGTMLCGAIPTAMAGLVTTPSGLIALRFFVGILGATFVPCQVWCTGFFDKSVVGTANALAGGWGNAGGGITYFVMPALFDSLVHSRGLTPHKAWRVAYIVPFIIIVTVATGMAITCDDTPTGKWSERHLVADQVLTGEEVHGATTPVEESGKDSKSPSPTVSDQTPIDFEKHAPSDSEAQVKTGTSLSEVKGEIIVAPTFNEALKVLLSKESLALAGPYACSFGSELAINSILSSYYLKNFPELGQTNSSNWAAMLGLLNVFFRPLGGWVGDVIYRKTNSVWGKKIWLIFTGIAYGVILIALGLSNPDSKSTMFGLIAGYALFMEASNGASFAVVPHVHPFANGILSGIVGAFGNLGGIIFAIVFRYNGTSYHQSIWIIGVICVAINVAVSWIPPIPRGQIGGH